MEQHKQPEGRGGEGVSPSQLLKESAIAVAVILREAKRDWPTATALEQPPTTVCIPYPSRAANRQQFLGNREYLFQYVHVENIRSVQMPSKDIGVQYWCVMIGVQLTRSPSVRRPGGSLGSEMDAHLPLSAKKNDDDPVTSRQQAGRSLVCCWRLAGR